MKKKGKEKSFVGRIKMRIRRLGMNAMFVCECVFVCLCVPKETGSKGRRGRAALGNKVKG